MAAKRRGGIRSNGGTAAASRGESFDQRLEKKKGTTVSKIGKDSEASLPASSSIALPRSSPLAPVCAAAASALPAASAAFCFASPASRTSAPSSPRLKHQQRLGAAPSGRLRLRPPRRYSSAHRVRACRPPAGSPATQPRASAATGSLRRVRARAVPQAPSTGQSAPSPARPLLPAAVAHPTLLHPSDRLRIAPELLHLASPLAGPSPGLPCRVLRPRPPAPSALPARVAAPPAGFSRRLLRRPSRLQPWPRPPAPSALPARVAAPPAGFSCRLLRRPSRLQPRPLGQPLPRPVPARAAPPSRLAHNSRPPPADFSSRAASAGRFAAATRRGHRSASCPSPQPAPAAPPLASIAACQVAVPRPALPLPDCRVAIPRPPAALWLAGCSAFAAAPSWAGCSSTGSGGPARGRLLGRRKGSAG
nr:translation initiation factor IF-2-like [Aegilops tauschii subsp. strangulata]